MKLTKIKKIIYLTMEYIIPHLVGTIIGILFISVLFWWSNFCYNHGWNTMCATYILITGIVIISRAIFVCYKVNKEETDEKINNSDK